MIEDELALRLSASYQEKTSDIEFAVPENEFAAEDEYHNVRLKALWQPDAIEGLEVVLGFNRIFDSPAAATVSGPDFFDRQANFDSAVVEVREMDADNYSADIAYELSDTMTLRSVTGYLDTSLGISSVPGGNFVRDDERRDSDLTQEFRLEIQDTERGLSGVAGLFYGSFEGETDSFITFADILIQAGPSTSETESWALYADLRYRLSDTVSVLFGGRLLDDTVSQSARFETFAGLNEIDAESDFQEFLPKGGIAFALTENQNLAFTVNKGYRQGFATTRTGQTGTFDVDPEFLWSYEVAYRLTAMQNRLSFNANAFFYDYTDQQVTVFDPDADPVPFTITLNAGDSEAYGFEFEGQYQFRNGIRAFASLGYLKTELGDFDDQSCTDGDCSGNSYSEAPELTAALGADYRHGSGFYANIATSYTDEFFWTIENEDSLIVDDVFLVNVKAGYDFSNYSVGVFVDNLLDEDYLTGILSEDLGVIGDGIAYGVEIMANF